VAARAAKLKRDGVVNSAAVALAVTELKNSALRLQSPPARAQAVQSRLALQSQTISKTNVALGKAKELELLDAPKETLKETAIIASAEKPPATGAERVRKWRAKTRDAKASAKKPPATGAKASAKKPPATGAERVRKWRAKTRDAKAKAGEEKTGKLQLIGKMLTMSSYDDSRVMHKIQLAKQGRAKSHKGQGRNESLMIAALHQANTATAVGMKPLCALTKNNEHSGFIRSIKVTIENFIDLMIDVDKFIDITIEGQTFDVALKQGGDAFPNVKNKPAYTQASIGLLMKGKTFQKFVYQRIVGYCSHPENHEAVTALFAELAREMSTLKAAPWMHRGIQLRVPFVISTIDWSMVVKEPYLNCWGANSRWVGYCFEGMDRSSWKESFPVKIPWNTKKCRMQGGLNLESSL
jgi:hypothetical protein